MENDTIHTYELHTSAERQTVCYELAAESHEFESSLQKIVSVVIEKSERFLSVSECVDNSIKINVKMSEFQWHETNYPPGWDVKYDTKTGKW